MVWYSPEIYRKIDTLTERKSSEQPNFARLNAKRPNPCLYSFNVIDQYYNPLLNPPEAIFLWIGKFEPDFLEIWKSRPTLRSHCSNHQDLKGQSYEFFLSSFVV